MSIKKKLNAKEIRRMRRSKFRFGLGTFTACMLSLIIFGLVNFIAMKIYYRASLDNIGEYDLSPKSLRLIDNIKGEMKIYALIQKSNSFKDEVVKLLGQYSFYLRKNTSLQYDIYYIDPDREVSKVESVANKFGLDKPNVVVFELNGNYKVVPLDNIAEYTKEITTQGIKSKLTAFKGEQLFSAAILDVARDDVPIVYFLSGHGEKDPANFHKVRGFSKIASLIEQDNIEIKQLLLASTKVIPEDAACVIVAGPVEQFALFEFKALAEYLQNGGRLMFLLDPMVDELLVKFLKNYGVIVGNDHVVDMTLQGAALLVAQYVPHPITENMSRVATMFFNPTSLTPDPNIANSDADKPLVFPLAMSGERSWAEKPLPNNKKLHFDKGVDTPGPLPVAVAVEVNNSENSLVLQTGRIIVFGDSYFVANGGLSQGIGGNRTIFLNSLNWLLDREQLLDVPPKNLSILELNFDKKQWHKVYIILCLGIPGSFALLGFIIWFARRK